jgi:hypothetical protein
MKYQIFRNTTVELLFSGFDCVFSGYSDISLIANDVDRYVWIYLPEIQADNNCLKQELEKFGQMFDYVLNKISADKTIIAITAECLFDANLDPGLNPGFCHEYNKRLYQISLVKPNVVIFNLWTFLSKHGSTPMIDWRYYFLSNILL